MKLPWVPDAADLMARRADVAIVGAPFDDAVSHRPGARFGPRAIREAQYTTGSIHSLQLGVEPFEILDVVDAGDANIIPAWIERSHAFIYRKVREVAATGAIPIVLGGDHSITWPSATAVADVRRPGSIGIVHFDAHADTANEDWGVLAGHGTPMRRLIESGAVKGRNFVQVGLRGYWPPVETFEWMKEHELRWHLMREVEERGAEAVIDDAIAEALDGPDADLHLGGHRRHRPGHRPPAPAPRSPAASCRASCCVPSAGSPAPWRSPAWTSWRCRRRTTTPRSPPWPPTGSPSSASRRSRPSASPATPSASKRGSRVSTPRMSESAAAALARLYDLDLSRGSGGPGPAARARRAGGRADPGARVGIGAAGGAARRGRPRGHRAWTRIRRCSPGRTSRRGGRRARRSRGGSGW